MEYIKNTGANNYRRGPPGAHKTLEHARPPKRALVGCGHPSPSLVPIFWYIRSFDLEKIRRGLSGRCASVSRWNLGRSTFALRWSDSAGGTSLQKGEIEVIVITNNPLIFGRPIFINIFNSTISSQNPSSSLVFNLCTGTSYWYLWVTSSVDYIL